MTSKTVAQKARLKPGTAIAVLNPVPGVVESLGLPPDTVFVDPAQAQIVFLFVTTRAELEAHMPRTRGSAGARRHDLGLLPQGLARGRPGHEPRRHLGPR